MLNEVNTQWFKILLLWGGETEIGADSCFDKKIKSDRFLERAVIVRSKCTLISEVVEGLLKSVLYPSISRSEFVIRVSIEYIFNYIFFPWSAENSVFHARIQIQWFSDNKIPFFCLCLEKIRTSNLFAFFEKLKPKILENRLDWYICKRLFTDKLFMRFAHN